MPIVFLLFGTSGTMQCQKKDFSTPVPKWTVKLDTFGWHPPRSISDKEFFKDFTIAKLEAQDPNTKICFVSNDVVVAYHTNEVGRDWSTASRKLEAFIISAKDGRLLDKKEWSTVARGSESDLIDSESRLVPISDGRFLVFANRTMLLYGNNLELLRQKRLEPSTSGDLWSAQSVAGGHKVFLRHQSSYDSGQYAFRSRRPFELKQRLHEDPSEQRTAYFWLSPDTLLPLSQMPGFSGKNFSVAVTAGDDFVLAGLGFSGPGVITGIGRIGLDGSTKATVCSDEICRGGRPSIVSSRFIALSSRYGIGVVDLEQGLVWSQRVPSTMLRINDFQLSASIKTAISGNRFAVWTAPTRKIVFDGVKLGSSPTLLLYDTNNPHHLLAIPVDRLFDFALSPDGSELAIFDGKSIRLYIVD